MKKVLCIGFIFLLVTSSRAFAQISTPPSTPQENIPQEVLPDTASPRVQSFTISQETPTVIRAPSDFISSVVPHNYYQTKLLPSYLSFLLILFSGCCFFLGYALLHPHITKGFRSFITFFFS